jgi:signal transduction histidine kinase
VTENEFSELAHRLKTPVAAIRGFAELLATRGDEETLRVAPAAIHQAAEHLAVVVDEVLLAFERDLLAER